MVNLILFLLRRGWRSPWAAFVATPCAPLKFKSFPQVHATGEFGTWNLVVFGVGQDGEVVFCWVVCHKMLVIYTPGTLTWNPGMKGFKQWCSFSKGWSSGSILVLRGVPILKEYIIAWLQQPPHATQGMQRSEAAPSHFQTDGPSLQPLRWQTFRSTPWVCFQGFASQGWGVPVQRIPLAKRRQKPVNL